ncbi:hemoglobin [Saccharicrinis carchari]|uniref:Hemoglobin n=1 Tax=Saccharicrinis carchari TaxID=1168039 RepID=A0A521AUT1_SACCC|nr:globin [Saccharicrinis carchari]SMO38564.1 hemoglobin [Saccharicrinis carchari]
MVEISQFKITTLPFGLRPKSSGPDIKIYDYLKEDGVRKMVNDHYDLLVESTIKDIFPPKGHLLEEAKKRSADFFVQRLGGPQYYKMSRGNPMLANRHLPFKITPKTRIVWLDCYRQVLSKLKDVPENLVLSFWYWLDGFSNWMVNQHDEPQFKMDFKLPEK